MCPRNADQRITSRDPGLRREGTRGRIPPLCEGNFIEEITQITQINTNKMTEMEINKVLENLEVTPRR